MTDNTTILTCVYCGYQYTSGTPAAKHKSLTDHIKMCEKHPLREAEVKIEKLKAALVGILGVQSKEELDSMEIILRALPSPASDKAAAIDAIDALRMCL